MAQKRLSDREYGDNLVQISFTPALAPFSWTVDGVTYTSTQPQCEIDTDVTFTVTVTFPPLAGRYLVKAEWDFGDGVRGYGQVVHHTFKFANRSVRVRCCTTDNVGNRVCVGQEIYLLPFTSHLLPSPSLFPDTPLYPF